MTRVVTRPAIFASAFAPHIGGVEELTRQLARQLAEREMRPCVVTMRWPKTLPQHEVIDGAPVYRHVFRVPEPHPRFFLGWLATARCVRRDVHSDLRRHGADLIHVQCVSGSARYALAASRELRLPLVVTMQGELTMDATGLYERSAQQRRAWRRLLDAADVVTGCSQSVIDDAAAAYPASWLERAHVVPNGIEPADFDQPDSGPADPCEHPRPYVLGLGRMVPQKGFDTLIRAFAEVANADPDLDLLLGGDGSERGVLDRLASSLGVAERVHFLGPLDRQQVVRVLRRAVTFVLPSRVEPQGIVVLEAMTAGVPVIATAVGGVPETVKDEVNGLLIEPAAPEQMATAIRRLLDDPLLRRQLVDSAQRTASTRAWAQITDRYLELYLAAGTHYAEASGSG